MEYECPKCVPIHANWNAGMDEHWTNTSFSSPLHFFVGTADAFHFYCSDLDVHATYTLWEESLVLLLSCTAVRWPVRSTNAPVDIFDGRIDERSWLDLMETFLFMAPSRCSTFFVPPKFGCKRRRLQDLSEFEIQESISAIKTNLRTFLQAKKINGSHRIRYSLNISFSFDLNMLVVRASRPIQCGGFWSAYPCCEFAEHK